MKNELRKLLADIEQDIIQIENPFDYIVYINAKYYNYIINHIDFSDFECRKSFLLKDDEAVIFLKKDFIKFHCKWEWKG